MCYQRSPHLKIDIVCFFELRGFLQVEKHILTIQRDLLDEYDLNSIMYDLNIK